MRRNAGNINNKIVDFNFPVYILLAIGTDYLWTGWYIIYCGWIHRVTVPTLEQAVKYVQEEQADLARLDHLERR